MRGLMNSWAAISELVCPSLASLAIWASCYNQLDKGGHFAAWEQPKAFVQELRAGFRSMR
ncbi:hypothetical protein [Micromonospora sp. 4G55]|uniref:hypothetical protein n=1 Tax=Micromonospora sp. 4G55 TaxID=2806102 RepID=UPI001A43D098|nr:hypothetical protein [Micromonospora sp. 4G55]MBM0256292.1 hypothetical protein [Micromonospora sp. 4G55]